jgi:hypothetical protein
MAELQEGYENAICRITKLEVDLASAVSGLKHSQADNEALIGSQADLLNNYTWLQDQHERLRHELLKEQAEHGQLAEEHQQQLAFWRSQLNQKARELEELREKGPKFAQSEASTKLIAEELEGSHRKQLQELEARLQIEIDRAAMAIRQFELARLENEHLLEEACERASAEANDRKLVEQQLQHRISALESELRLRKDAAGAASQDKARVELLEANISTLQQTLQEQERRYDADRKGYADELLARSEELSVARRRLHDLQADSETRERALEQASSEAEGFKREHTRIVAQLAEARAQLQITRHAEDLVHTAELQEELDLLRHDLSAERQQFQRRTQSVEDQLQTVQSSLRRSEMRCRELEEELVEREQILNSEVQQAQCQRDEALNNLRTDMDRSNKEAEARWLTWREKEADLMRRLDVEKSRADAASDELVQCRFADQEVDQRLRELQQKCKQRESAASAELQKQKATMQVDLTCLRDRVERVERERNEHAAVAEALRSSLRDEQDRSDALSAEVTSLRQRFDSEQDRWVREADEAHAAALCAEEERRKRAIHKLSEQHRRQIAKLETASKSALQKGARKRQELRQRCRELAKRVMQLQQEQRHVMRVCGAGQASCESQLADSGVSSHLSMGQLPGNSVLQSVCDAVDKARTGSSGSVDAMQRGELCGILERLEMSAARL